jgi:hypothetical protein
MRCLCVFLVLSGCVADGTGVVAPSPLPDLRNSPTVCATIITPGDYCVVVVKFEESCPGRLVRVQPPIFEHVDTYVDVTTDAECLEITPTHDGFQLYRITTDGSACTNRVISQWTHKRHGVPCMPPDSGVD